MEGCKACDEGLTTFVSQAYSHPRLHQSSPDDASRRPVALDAAFGWLRRLFDSGRRAVLRTALDLRRQAPQPSKACNNRPLGPFRAPSGPEKGPSGLLFQTCAHSCPCITSSPQGPTGPSASSVMHGQECAQVIAYQTSPVFGCSLRSHPPQDYPAGIRVRMFATLTSSTNAPLPKQSCGVS